MGRWQFKRSSHSHCCLLGFLLPCMLWNGGNGQTTVTASVTPTMLCSCSDPQGQWVATFCHVFSTSKTWPNVGSTAWQALDFPSEFRSTTMSLFHPESYLRFFGYFFQPSCVQRHYPLVSRNIHGHNDVWLASFAIASLKTGSSLSISGFTILTVPDTVTSWNPIANSRGQSSLLSVRELERQKTPKVPFPCAVACPRGVHVIMRRRSVVSLRRFLLVGRHYQQSLWFSRDGCIIDAWKTGMTNHKGRIQSRIHVQVYARSKSIALTPARQVCAQANDNEDIVNNHS